MPHAALTDRIDDAIRPEHEPRSALFQLLDLPAIQIPEINQPLAENFVADLVGRELRTGVLRHEAAERIVQLLLREKTASQSSAAHHGLRRVRRHTQRPTSL